MSFLEEFEQTLAGRCHQNEPPFCQASCPFGLDIKGMEEKWRKGRFNAAYRTYQNTVGFPEIVAEICDRPCEKACIRGQVDRAVAIGLLERATTQYARRKAPNAYNLPSKGKRIAVIGAGLSGLGCALRLSNKKYEVTVFEKENNLGGQARAIMDPAALEADIENQFQFETWEKRLGVNVASLDEIKEEFDAVYVATGAGGDSFGLELDECGAFATKTPGIFMGGSMTGCTVMEALAQGLDASLAVERYLKTGGMNEPFKKKGTMIQMDTSRIEKKERIDPENGRGYSEEEARSETERCLKCSCDACMRECDLMRIFEKTPRRIYEEVYITIHPGTLSRDGTWATRLITTCDQCGLCKSVCPQRIDMGQFLLQSHQAMHKKGAMPWAFHDYWLRDMEFSANEAKVCRKPDHVEKSTYVFFPGCQLAASDSRYVTKTYEWLLSKKADTALWMNCCGAPAEWAGNEQLHGAFIDGLRAEWRELGEPTVIFSCPTCRKMFLQYLPEIPGVFLPQVMEEWGVPEPDRERDYSESYAVFDPCASREFPELQKSVRNLVDSMGISRESLSHEGDKARCCSYGGQISIAAPLYSREVARERLTEKEVPYITYCVNCRDTFASQEKEAVHLLDLVFGLNDDRRIPPTVTERRKQRLKAKAELLETYWNEKTEEAKEMKLEVGEALERKLSRSQILVSDMEQVVEHCQREGCGVQNTETGRISGHLKIQNMTYWAEYEELPEGGFKLWNGYAHRMNLEGE